MWIILFNLFVDLFNCEKKILLKKNKKFKNKMQNHTYFFEDIIIQSVVSSKSVNFITYFSPVTILFSIILTGIFVVYNSKRSRMVKLINKIPGPPALPFIGNTVECNVDHDGEKQFFYLDYFVLTSKTYLNV